MSKPKIILIGAGGHSHACIDVLEQQDKYQIAGLVGTPDEMHVCHLGYNVIAIDEDLPRLVAEYQHAHIAVGQLASAGTRRRLYQQVAALGFQLPVLISPHAYVSAHACIGPGTIVMHGAIINAGANVGDNSIINTRSLVEHDAVVGDHCHISTGAIVNGGVNIGMGSFVGSGSAIKEGISLGEGCVVGMGLSVRHDQANHTRYLGDKKI